MEFLVTKVKDQWVVRTYNGDKFIEGMAFDSASEVGDYLDHVSENPETTMDYFIRVAEDQEEVFKTNDVKLLLDRRALMFDPPPHPPDTYTERLKEWLRS